ncbi:MAG: hypothetical protein M1120_01965 [Patescibacteria group bacterium]|nr:hypothetical protein [Patescibacteria group bacterium]
MLTKNDLSQIRDVVSSTVHSEGAQIRSETRNVIRQELNPLKKQLRKMQKKIDLFIDFLDKQDMELLKKVKKIEEHLGFSTLQ